MTFSSSPCVLEPELAVQGSRCSRFNNGAPRLASRQWLDVGEIFKMFYFLNSAAEPKRLDKMWQPRMPRQHSVESNACGANHKLHAGDR